MQLFLEALAALLAGAGLFLLGRLLLGRLHTPAGARAPVFAVVAARGGGEDLERDVRGLLWLHGSELARLTVVLADCGLNDEGRAVARLLHRQHPQVLLCPAERVGALVADAGRTPDAP